jgi:hypothetical protein
MKMIPHRMPIVALAAALVLLAVTPSSVLAGASEADFNAAYAEAEAANKQAGVLRDQWTTTATALANAKKAAEAGNFDAALAEAKEAEALAKASVLQATQEKEAWKAEVIR